MKFESGAAVGIGVRWPHLSEIAANGVGVDFLELTTENVFSAGKASYDKILSLADRCPISLHGVALNLGGTANLSKKYLSKLAYEVETLKPQFVSDHLCWSGSDSGGYLPELLPLPFSLANAERVAARISEVQDIIGSQILIENVSAYFEHDGNEMHEVDFLNEIVQRSGCAILLDVNNIYVNSINCGLDPLQYILRIKGEVKEFHLSGHIERNGMIIDSHSTEVKTAVWQLFKQTVAILGPRPTLIEWDQDIPSLSVLMNEAQKAKQILGHKFGTCNE